MLTTLLEVWGTGTASASRWYSLGVRTLDNLRSRTDLNLTEQQRVRLPRPACSYMWQRLGGSSSGHAAIPRHWPAQCRLQPLHPLAVHPYMAQVGLKYYDDLKQKIPRAEVAQTEKIVRETCFELIGGLGCPAWWAHLAVMYGRPVSPQLGSYLCCRAVGRHSGCGAHLLLRHRQLPAGQATEQRRRHPHLPAALAEPRRLP